MQEQSNPPRYHYQSLTALLKDCSQKLYHGKTTLYEIFMYLYCMVFSHYHIHFYLYMLLNCKRTYKLFIRQNVNFYSTKRIIRQNVNLGGLWLTNNLFPFLVRACLVTRLKAGNQQTQLVNTFGLLKFTAWDT